jgi:hypothetical protein
MNSKTYQGNPCKRGHDGRRYVNDGKCVACIRERNAARFSLIRATTVRGETFQGNPCKHGHDGMRYAHGGGCVACAKENGSKPARKAWHEQYWLTQHAKNVAKAYRARPDVNVKIKRREKARRTPERKRHVRNQLLGKYGLTEKLYDDRLRRQFGMCPICNKPASQTNKPFGIDHNHKTGEVRGLICDTCNLGIGLFKDNPQALMNAARYLSEPAFKYLFVDIWLAEEIHRLKELLK